MARHGRAARWLLAAVAVLAPAAAARADDTEHRRFSIEVDGKPAGECRMSITRKDDGTEVMANQASVRVKILITYTWTYQGTEVWKGGKLQSLQSSTNDNGKRYEVGASAVPNGLQVKVNGKERVTAADVWTTSYWKLADARFHNNPVTLLDCDRAEELPRKLVYVGTEELNAAGQAQKCYHFRVTGGRSPVDLWFDVQHRLVRQDFVEQGHRTVIHLTAVNR
jgi:hypothetical protein